MKLSVLSLTLVGTTALAAPTASSPFVYNNVSFLLHGEPFQIIGGQMDPQRVPRAYWKDRLQKAKAMGLNTIFSYIFWNELEPSPGQWDWEGVDGVNDISAWYDAIQEANLYAVLRPGPYVCGEREWGGFPAWLSQILNMSVRTNNPQFLSASKNYLTTLGSKLAKHQITNGGPILMAQVENEYGNFASDHIYTAALADIMRESFDITLYTNDAGNQGALNGGQVPGVLAEIDGAPSTGFQARNEYVTNPSSLGPLLDGEYYVKWFSAWGPRQTYPTISGINRNDAQIVQDIQSILSGGNSLSIYMWHGGTNFGYGNGALNFGTTEPFTTSYDYSAPLDESGRPTNLYNSIRAAIQSHLLNTTGNGNLPAVPYSPPVNTVGNFDLAPVSFLFDKLPKPTLTKVPICMEALGQSYGFVLYEHTVAQSISGLLKPGDKARDRVIVYVNDVKKGVIDSIYKYPANVSVDLSPGDKISLLVENLGRVDYGYAIMEQSKGIISNITVGGKSLPWWNAFSLPISEPPSNLSKGNRVTITTKSPPTWYTGQFTVDTTNASADTFLQLEGAVKGVVWVNGYNLGRYWTVGPQQQLYVPGCMLKAMNEVVVLELEPQTGVGLSGKGVSTRSWQNNVDPDCENCQ